ncbi:MAG: hypothetical protein Q4G00_14890 [Clostridia bacterium]|nr:hypothetical protein [Clostridia bacterium]
MKKLLCFALILLLLFPSALADTPARKLEESEPLYISLYERAMEYAGLFNEALHSEDYLALMRIPSDYGEELALVQMQDFTQPISVTIVQTEDAFAVYEPDDPYIRLFAADLSPALKALTWQKVYERTGTILANQGGVSTMALSNALALSDAFIQPEEMTAPCFIVMQYGGLYAFLVTFYPTANGTVTANAQFIPSRAADDLNLPNE